MQSKKFVDVMKYKDNEMQEFNLAAKTCLSLVIEKLDRIETRLRNVSTWGGAIRGEAADSIDAYIYEVPYPVLYELKNISERYLELLGIAFSDFYGEVDDAPYLINSEYLDHLSSHIRSKISELREATASVDSLYASYSDILDPQKPNVPVVADYFSDSRRFVDKAKDDLFTFNQHHATDLDIIDERLDIVRAICTTNNATKLNGNVFTYTSFWAENEHPSLARIRRIFTGVNTEDLLMDENVMRIYSRMAMVNTNGDVIYNFDVVYELLQKDRDQLTQDEIAALTLFYLTVDTSTDGYTCEENLERFIACGYVTVKREYETPDGSIAYYYVEQTDAFRVVCVATEYNARYVLNLTNEGYLEYNIENVNLLKERMYILQVATQECSSIRMGLPSIRQIITDDITFDGGSPVILTRNSSGGIDISAAVGAKSAGENENSYYTYGNPAALGGPNSMGYYTISSTMLARTENYAVASGYNDSFLSWLASEGGDFSISEVIGKVAGFIIPESSLLSVGAGFLTSAGMSAFGDIQDYARTGAFLTDMRDLEMISSLGGQVSYTDINGNIVVNHTNYAYSESYLYTGFFASQYQEQYPDLTATQARAILINAAEGHDALPFELYGYTVEQQEAIVADYAFCYTDQINGAEIGSPFTLYNRDVVVTIINNRLGDSIDDVSYIDLQRMINETNRNFNTEVST